MPVSDAIAPVVRVPVTVHETSDAVRWDAFVDQHPDATGYHLWAWKGVFERVFGHRSIYLTAERDGVTTGVLPLVAFRSAIFGRFLVSLPFVNYGGVLASDEASANALVARAASIARELRASHVELRHRSRRFEGLTPKEHKVSMLLPLAESADALWTALDRKVRNQVRKAEKSGLTPDAAGAETLKDFYDVFAHNMRDLGTPVYSRRFFQDVLATFPDRASLVVVREAGSRRPVATALTWRWRDTVEVPWASSLREFNAMAPNNLLYWTIIQRAIAGGASVLDFGRSTPGEGTFHFKRQWGAEPLPLCWEYDLIDGGLPDQSPKNPKFGLAIRMWKQLPVPIANAIGPRIVRSIP
jgi:FemAB-related protein (PEP-CTERM system-associated)